MSSRLQYFKSVWISSIALIKMVIHARSGGRLEIIGVMQGKVLRGMDITNGSKRAA